MKFAVGYQYFNPEEESFVDIIKDFNEKLEEVYFSWMDQPSARSPAASASGLSEWEAKERLEKDLLRLKEMKIKLDLLFNANCYGEKCLSRELINTVCSTVSYLNDKIGLDAISTTSLIIAETVKKYFPDIEIRASVNLRIGTIQGLEYVKDLFDSFYLQREYNRDLEKINEIHKWCIKHNKKLCLLANSGCLNFCSAQTFHDNLVAHLKRINEIKNLEGYNPILCQRYYSNTSNWISILKDSSWIRPEDTKNYENSVHIMKLATRTHENPRQVIQAYASEKFRGNLLDLTEPGHGMRFKGHILDNNSFPDDWFHMMTNCKNEIDKHKYCESILKKALIKMDNY
ncbi:MAG: hypothetical protein A2X49_06505 [Lentisphaerae bacterium GWF2_52_8]|nr:MAG: hypothetical protein A2X49_06505 [Lentisphaerae bacterium GWF2_52_8]